MIIETKTKSHPRVTYLHANNFYAAINAADGSNSESGNLAKRFHANNQQKCVDSFKARSNKNERGCKKCGCDYFYVSNIKVVHL